MSNLISAIEEEKKYITDKMNNIDTSLLNRLSQYGYSSLDEYFIEKKEYLFSQWHPEVYPINVNTITTELEYAVRNEKYGVYISETDSLYAFHGSEEIDYDLCKELNICVAELYHQGGTIIGSDKDLGIEIIAPASVELDGNYVMKNVYNIISKYIDGAVISGNDILVNGEKIMGSMVRNVGNAFVWAAQISFEDHSETIAQICNKQSTKKPGYINSEILTKDKLKEELLSWLQKL